MSKTINIANKILFLLLLTTLNACASAPEIRPGKLAANTVKLSNTAAVSKQLYAQHREWQGVEYQMGGLSKNGIDCSGFVYNTFRTKLGINIPRTTKLQSKIGHSISKKNLRAGDLIFFKTATKVRHVGIYIGSGKFLHASTSKGVMISKLNNVYWQSKYWKAKRP